eukprot:SAG22_NODE_179_length_16124_cov_7.355445_7_plen_466_part_00
MNISVIVRRLGPVPVTMASSVTWMEADTLTWMEADTCAICNESFSFFFRRHHCRMCGRSVCDAHSQKRMAPHQNLSRVRTCDTCFAMHPGTQEEPEPKPEPEPESHDNYDDPKNLLQVSSPFFLASCPVVSIDSEGRKTPCIERGILISLKFGGEYCVGDKYDKLNRDILDPANEAWKTAWKGKTSQTYRMLKRIHRNEKIVAAAVKGGPACDWEREELLTNFCPKYPDMELKLMDTFEEFEAWVNETYPWMATDGSSHCAFCIESATHKRITDPVLTLVSELALSHNQITDLAPLSALTSLRQLWLNDNQITDLAPLSALTWLFELGLFDNQITDLAPLAALTALRVLDLNLNQITDLAPLAALTSLTELELWGNQITDLAPLAALTSLAKLELHTNQITDITPLAALTSLRQLALTGNRITDVAPLSALTSLRYLFLDGNPGPFSDSDETVRLLQSRGCHVGL